MSKTILKALLLGASITAYADPIEVTLGGTTVAGEGQYTSVAGATTVNLNTAAAAGGTYNYGVLTYYMQPGNLVTGSLGGQYAAPTGDTTRYLSVGPSASSPVAIESSVTLNYFGFYASSVDDYNTIQFWRDETLVLTLTGTDLATLGGFAPNGQISTFVNIHVNDASKYFNRIELRSSSNAFESDNHAFGAAYPSPVPEPSAAALCAGLATLALSASRLKRGR